MENGGGLGGSHHRGKMAMAASVDERRVAWPCTEESEGGKRRVKHGGVGQLFEAEVVRQRRGVRGWSPHGGRERGRQRGPWAWHITQPAKQGRGRGADRWAAATVPGSANSN
jgi:hypothetical protein